MENFIIIKAAKTEIDFNGLRDWYLETHVGRHRIERYRDLDGRIRWKRTDTVKEARERDERRAAKVAELDTTDPEEADWLRQLWGMDVADDDAPNPIAEDHLTPEYHEVEMDGEIVLCGNTDATIQMMGNSDTPEARDLMGKYRDALAALKDANGGTSTMFMREEAFQTAMEQVGIVVEVSAASQGATQ